MHRHAQPMDYAEERAATLKRLRKLLDDAGPSKVTLIGDVMLDRFHHGYANNLDSTAPSPFSRFSVLRRPLEQQLT